MSRDDGGDVYSGVKFMMSCVTASRVELMQTLAGTPML